MKKKTLTLLIFFIVLALIFLMTVQTDEISNVNVNILGIPKSNSVTAEDCRNIVKQLTTPQYTKHEIKQWVEKDLSLDEWVEKISTPADAIQMLNAMEYNKVDQNLQIDTCQNSDITRTAWIFDYSAEQNFDLRYGHCAGTANLINRLLMDDFDEMGYVLYCNSIEGGHIINYFKINDVYVMCDFIGIPGVALYHGNYPVDTQKYIVYMSCNLEDFTEYYKEKSPIGMGTDPREGQMAYMALYKYKGDPLPTGFDYDDSTVFVLSEDHKDCYNILFIRDGYSVEFRPLEAAVIPSFRKGKMLQ